MIIQNENIAYIVIFYQISFKENKIYYNKIARCDIT